MLRSLQEIVGYQIEASDGELGRVKDFYFDDVHWGARYVLVDTGKWLPGRKVLVAPGSVGRPDHDRQVLPVDLTREQVADSPSIDADRPVSRQKEQELMEYFGWQPYWEPLGMFPGQAPVPHRRRTPPDSKGDPNLRSAKAISGYRIDATDGEMGKVADFIADTNSWVIRYVVAGTGNWLSGRKVLVAPAWIRNVDWEAHQVHLELSKEQVRHSPEYDPKAPINREYEVRLYDYYGRPRYWK